MGDNTKILIVEDDPAPAELVGMYLAKDGHDVVRAADGLAGLRKAREDKPDLVILDLMLPKLDGMEVCRTLRAESNVPIIMVTARVEEDDRLVGLDLGADDYVTKPFKPRELAARVRAVLRRASRDAEGNASVEITHNGIAVYLRTRRATANGERLPLTPTEFRLLAVFSREPERVFSREQLLDQVFGDDFDGFDRAVDTHIYNLRRKLEKGSGGKKYIHTVYGEGYRFGHD
ncbi:MAG: response regulator transcription factor [Chloroflexi bacterium]|nr:response regulator transcription factor [Chloroflexota bacterium]